METEQVAVQPTVGSIAQTPQNAFVVPNGELKDFYLKLPPPSEPEFLLRKPYRIRTLKHSSERLEKKLWEHSLTSPCMPGMMVYRKSCSHAVTPYKTT